MGVQLRMCGPVWWCGVDFSGLPFGCAILEFIHSFIHSFTELFCGPLLLCGKSCASPWGSGGTGGGCAPGTLTALGDFGTCTSECQLEQAP